MGHKRKRVLDVERVTVRLLRLAGEVGAVAAAHHIQAVHTQLARGGEGRREEVKVASGAAQAVDTNNILFGNGSSAVVLPQIVGQRVRAARCLCNDKPAPPTGCVSFQCNKGAAGTILEVCFGYDHSGVVPDRGKKKNNT